MSKNIEIWTDGTTGGFNIDVDGQVTYFSSYETAHAALVAKGVLSQPAAVALDSAQRKAKP